MLWAKHSPPSRYKSEAELDGIKIIKGNISMHWSHPGRRQKNTGTFLYAWYEVMEKMCNENGRCLSASDSKCQDNQMKEEWYRRDRNYTRGDEKGMRFQPENLMERDHLGDEELDGRMMMIMIIIQNIFRVINCHVKKDDSVPQS